MEASIQHKKNVPLIIPREKHNISRVNISKNVLKVLYRLKDEGFEAYLVGGCIRDLLCELHPKDFDVATDARPNQIKQLFRNCRLIGKRFRLAHICFGHEIIEVATFRGESNDSDQRKHSQHGMILRDNVYGTLAEDAFRRDFAINALYYNVRDFSLVDYVGGMNDFYAKLIRIIGDPTVRYHEDPVRMLRAVRIAAKLGFEIEAKTKRPIKSLVGLLQNVSPARLFDEVIKWFSSGKSLVTFHLLQQYGLFAVLFPQTEAGLGGVHALIANAMLQQGFISTDTRILQGKKNNPAFLLAVLLWWPLQEQLEHHAKKMPRYHALVEALHVVSKKQMERITIPRRLSAAMREIWNLQYHLTKCHGKKSRVLLHHPRFRAAYDFLLLRAAAGEDVKEIAEWWTEKQQLIINKREFHGQQNYLSRNL